jgi:recombination associated protein RdgC
MWFKNLQVFKLTEALAVSAEQLEEQLGERTLRECGPQEPRTLGWVSPLAQQIEATEAPLVQRAAGCLIISMGSEERLLPASVVREELEERILMAEQKDGRKPSRKEKTALKEEVEFELMPKAFTRRKSLRLLIDPVDGWVIIDSAAAGKAEEMLSLLRESIGTLKVLPMQQGDVLMDAMTLWLKGASELPGGLEIGFDVELRETGEDNGVIRCANFNLQGEEVQNALNMGRVVSRLGFIWQDRMSFVLNDKAAFMRLKFLDKLQEQLDEAEADSREIEFDAIMTLMMGEIRPLLNGLSGYLIAN